MSIGDCWSTFNILHEVFGSEEDSDEVSEPVGAFIHDSRVSVPDNNNLSRIEYFIETLTCRPGPCPPAPAPPPHSAPPCCSCD